MRHQYCKQITSAMMCCDKICSSVRRIHIWLSCRQLRKQGKLWHDLSTVYRDCKDTACLYLLVGVSLDWAKLSASVRGIKLLSWFLGTLRSRSAFQWLVHSYIVRACCRHWHETKALWFVRCFLDHIFVPRNHEIYPLSCRNAILFSASSRTIIRSHANPHLPSCRWITWILRVDIAVAAVQYKFLHHAWSSILRSVPRWCINDSQHGSRVCVMVIVILWAGVGGNTKRQTHKHALLIRHCHNTCFD